MKNSYDMIGNRTHNLPVCSAVAQPTALPRAPLTLLEAQNTSNDYRTGSCYTAQQQAGLLSDLAESNLRKSRIAGETDSPTT